MGGLPFLAVTFGSWVWESPRQGGEGLPSLAGV